jgi:hypothetical protein
MLDRTGKLLIINYGENIVACTVHNVPKILFTLYQETVVENQIQKFKKILLCYYHRGITNKIILPKITIDVVLGTTVKN